MPFPIARFLRGARTAVRRFAARLGGLCGSQQLPEASRPTSSRPPIVLREGEAHLVVVMAGKVLEHTSDVSLSHAEFVRRTLGSLPNGAWVGTVRKSGREVVAMNSRTFYQNQLPAPQCVLDAVRAEFV